MAKGKNIAYVRVSTTDQNEARQNEALDKYNIDKASKTQIANELGISRNTLTRLFNEYIHKWIIACYKPSHYLSIFLLFFYIFHFSHHLF